MPIRESHVQLSNTPPLPSLKAHLVVHVVIEMHVGATAANATRHGQRQGQTVLVQLDGRRWRRCGRQIVSLEGDALGVSLPPVPTQSAGKATGMHGAAGCQGSHHVRERATANDGILVLWLLVLHLLQAAAAETKVWHAGGGGAACAALAALKVALYVCHKGGWLKAARQRRSRCRSQRRRSSRRWWSSV